ncbi:ATP-dependent 23S rRNA helicase DbpA [Marinobacterium lacunae]|uniref:ATP-dependent 23S rRNA helicase DbpA n=1 Tax=Marinobacterium lacunae TaxID=1232683 RepID=A0A081G2Y7_9GAMM|nr:ATP-dependent RNA helicase DbpA [Marinobacterium lacunae]KEA65142.1 ATP-dependent 23S rRNA helicase DbpA [Marinobacterium lacunae]
MTQTRFSTLNLPAAQIENLTSIGYEQMTPIQQLSLPVVLAGQDLIAQAKTGSGKTAAFGIGLLTTLKPRLFAAQALVLCPTRELATQVAKELRRLARYLENIKIVTLCGGTPIGPQIGSLEHGAHIVVGTPGRIKDHLRKGTLTLDRVSCLVLDEADRMLDMGFAEDIGVIIDSTPSSRQTLLFSATYPQDIEQLSAHYQRDPQRVTAAEQHSSVAIEQRAYLCDEPYKADTLIALLQQQAPEAAVIFCNTKGRCDEYAEALKSAGFQVGVLHGDMEQRERDQRITLFSNRSLTLLVATDVAARGLDIDAVDLVVNVDLPREPAVYTHRIGRTGRAGRSGVALSLVGPKESIKLERINALQEAPIDVIEQLPTPNHDHRPPRAPMRTLAIAGGRKNKLRPGDIVGTLTAGGELTGDDIGSIDIGDFTAYVAVKRELSEIALDKLKSRTIKGKSYRVRKL